LRVTFSVGDAPAVRTRDPPARRARRHGCGSLDRIREGPIAPDVIATHTLPLAEAARDYKLFDE